MKTLGEALLVTEKYYKVWDNRTNSWFKAGYSRKSKWATKAGASNAIAYYKKHLASYNPPLEYDLTIVRYESTGVIDEIKTNKDQE